MKYLAVIVLCFSIFSSVNAQDNKKQMEIMFGSPKVVYYNPKDLTKLSYKINSLLILPIAIEDETPDSTFSFLNDLAQGSYFKAAKSDSSLLNTNAPMGPFIKTNRLP